MTAFDIGQLLQSTTTTSSLGQLMRVKSCVRFPYQAKGY